MIGRRQLVDPEKVPVIRRHRRPPPRSSREHRLPRLAGSSAPSDTSLRRRIMASLDCLTELRIQLPALPEQSHLLRLLLLLLLLLLLPFRLQCRFLAV